MTIAHYTQRPSCINKGCSNPAHKLKEKSPNYFYYANKCSSCIKRVAAEKRGLTLTQYNNLYHPYRKFRKDFCENVDARLGFKCTTTVIWDGMLDVDHKNGNPSDNRKSNIQTLCKCCHAYKTSINEDHKSPGRAFFGIRR